MKKSTKSDMSFNKFLLLILNQKNILESKFLNKKNMNMKINQYLVQHKRFKSLGWNVIYDFNDSDWETADNILLILTSLKESSLVADTNALIDSIISLSPQSVKAGEESMETKVQKLIQETLCKVPQEIDMQETIEKVRPGDQNPLKIVLMQEISRYNKLLNTVRTSLINLDKGLSGLVLISEDLETIMHSFWIVDLEKRVLQLRSRIKQQPSVFWISGFSFPTRFTTALLQQSARKVNTPIDQFRWEFSFLPLGSEPQAAQDGAYIYGLFLEGPKWDEKNYIVDDEPMKSHDQLPIILFKPVSQEGKSKSKKGQTFISVLPNIIKYVVESWKDHPFNLMLCYHVNLIQVKLLMKKISGLKEVLLYLCNYQIDYNCANKSTIFINYLFLLITILITFFS
ncbi:unnamed protein product [Paramecium sonneborni]|uniref:Dynein heavy chain C-terminal domain-containing protein n=1 Tax=Paramecium sonneborni TaxID=65129 RepID=A0A8S1QGZ4_9CILI|nr:unnamed protein product [Paramecium sonneborni]